MTTALVWPLIAGELASEIRQIDPAPPSSRRVLAKTGFVDLWPFGLVIEEGPDA